MTERDTKEELSNLPDDKNPKFLFNGTHTDLLVKIAGREINARKLALEQLRNRGLDKQGKWVGFDR